MPDSQPNIVADGHDRLRDSHEYREAVERITREVEGRFQSEMAKAPFWRRLWLRHRIRRTIRAELDKLFPPDALYLTHGN